MEQIRVGIYARVSTADKGQDPDLQLGPLKEYAWAREWTVCQEYADNRISGAKERRPALDQLMADARRCLFDAVLVWRFDRWVDVRVAFSSNQACLTCLTSESGAEVVAAERSGLDRRVVVGRGVEAPRAEGPTDIKWGLSPIFLRGPVVSLRHEGFEHRTPTRFARIS